MTAQPHPIVDPSTTRPSAAGSPDDRVHVVFSIDTMSVGGTEMNALRTAERLDSRRFRITVVTLRGEGPLAARYEAIGIPVVRFPIQSLYAPATIRQGMRLAGYFRRERVSVVHCHDQYSNFFTVLAARHARVPVIIASKRWLHSPLRYRIANGVGFRVATRVLANSEAVAKSLERDDHLSRTRTVVVPNFVDESAFDPPSAEELRHWRSDLGLVADDLVVGVVASLTPIKDHATLFDAIAQLAPTIPRLRLVVVGDGPLSGDLRAKADALGIGNVVRFAGHRPNVPSFHFLFDISTLTSVSEGFPNSLVEAMAAGRPIVATNVGGVPDAVHVGQTGLLVPPGDAAGLAKALGVLLADEPSRERMGATALRRARTEFHASAVVSALERLYDDLLRKRSL